MISRSRSTSRAAAMSIERTTSANSTVTCLYSAAATEATSAAPQPSQNRAPSRGAAPHDRHTAGAAVTASSADPAVLPDRLIRQAYGCWHAAMGERATLTYAKRTCAGLSAPPTTLREQTLEGDNFAFKSQVLVVVQVWP